MVLGRKRQRIPEKRAAAEPPAPEPTPPPAGGNAEAERVLDTLAAVLRAQGDLAFDVDERTADEIRILFDGWARHALVGAPRPAVDRADAPPANAKRDWPGLTRFANEHRRRENDYVTRSLSDLRQVIWIFIQGVARSITEDGNADVKVSERLGRLRRSIDQNDTGELKREALSSITFLEELMASRKEREREQFEQLSGRIDDVRDQLARAREKLETDDLTGAYARGALDEYIERIINLGVVSGRTATLYMIDCDDFKWVNDKFGHAAGDDVLRAVSGCMRTRFRRASDFVGRFGGDEFAIIVPNGALDQVRELGESLLHMVRDLEIACGGESIRVSISVGCARLVPGETSRAWLERADRALYKAKQAGRDRLVQAETEAATESG